MNTAGAINQARAIHAEVSESELVVNLDDGRKISLPLEWYPRLAYGTPKERAHFDVIGNGAGLHWPALDEDISVESMLAGRRAGESEASLEKWKSELDRRRRDPHPAPWVESAPLPDWWETER
jgi:hypothetical protein